jgi:hypothetical protein
MLTIFDAVSYLDSRNIPYTTRGKNVTAGWVNIQCPKWDCDDASNHMGVSLSTGLHSCWKCGAKGGPEKLIMELEEVDWVTAHTTAVAFGVAPTHSTPTAQPAGVPPGRGLLPKLSAHLPKPHQRYLLNRGFNPKSIIQKYNIGGTYNTGDRRYRMRVIAPIYMYGELVSFTGRTIVGADPKYRMPNDEDAAMPGHTVVYGLDNVKHGICAIVEGVTDVWRVGDGAIAFLRTRFTEEQLNHLSRSGIHRAYIIYDAGAEKLGKELASRVSKLVPETIYVPLDRQDPATLNPADLQQIRKWLRGA